MVYDLCLTFLHVAQVKKPTAMRESRVIQKRATKSDTSGHCLGATMPPA